MTCGHYRFGHRRGWGMAGAYYARRFGGGGDGDNGSRRARRFFEHGDLRLVVLKLIADRPSHGYDLIKAIGEMVGDGYSPSPGVIYPTLTLLEEQGFVVAESVGAKKLYTITADGEAFLADNRDAVDALFARIDAAGAARARDEHPSVLRAMENLRTALRLRIRRGDLDDEAVRAIAAALDEAAIKVERS